MTIFLLILSIFCLPIMIIALTHRVTQLRKLGVVTLSFLTGILISLFVNYLSSIYVISETALQSWSSAQSTALDVSIAFALPLIMFAFNIKLAFSAAKKLLLPMLLSVVAIMSMSVILATIYNQYIEDIWQYSSLAFGAYVGGGVNMAVIQTAINADEMVFITMTAYDLLISSMYLMLVLTLGVPLARKFLDVDRNVAIPVNNHKCKQAIDDSNASTIEHSKASFSTTDIALMMTNEEVLLQQLFQSKYYKSNLIAIILSAFLVGSSVYLASFFASDIKATMTIIIITSLALIASLIRKVGKLNSYAVGNYLLLVFCLTMGSMFDIKIMQDVNILLLTFLILLVFGSMFLHLLLCRLCKVDADRFVLTSVASIMSLPFIPLIISRLKRADLMVAGICVSILGYVLGTYLGISLAGLLIKIL